MGKGGSMRKRTTTIVKRHGMILRADRPGLAKVWPSTAPAADSSTVCTVDPDEVERDALGPPDIALPARADCA